MRLPWFQGTFVFIAPPNMGQLEDRLRGRGTEAEDAVRLRLKNAVGELEMARWMSWDGWVVNDDLDAAYARLCKALDVDDLTERA